MAEQHTALAHQFDDLSQESFQMYIQLLVYEVLAEWVLLKEGKVSPGPEQVRKAKISRKVGLPGYLFNAVNAKNASSDRHEKIYLDDGLLRQDGF